MKSTVVPNRNMILLALAGGHALSLGFDTIAYAAHAGDHTIYPDCRPEFADAMEKALGLADWKDLNLHRPYVEMTKSDLVSLGDQLDAPLYLTWSCYAGGKIHCGKCGTCVERKEAFELANIADPTNYEEQISNLMIICTKTYRDIPCPTDSLYIEEGAPASTDIVGRSH